MNTRTPLLIALLAVPFSVQASDVIKQLSDHTGVSERKVQMILGARSSFAEYPYTYQRSLEKFRAALGEENYRRLMEREDVVLEPRTAMGDHHRVAEKEPAREADGTVPGKQPTGS